MTSLTAAEAVTNGTDGALLRCLYWTLAGYDDCGVH
jgi:hypothetical protein